MAKRKPPAVADDDTPEAKERASLKALHAEAIREYKLDIEADSENRKGYEADMLFTLKPGEQWLKQDKDDRGKERPMYEFNELRIKCKSTINHIRANRPQAKFSGTEDGDKELAEIKQGIFLNIWNNSDGDSVTDYAAIHQVVGGYGAIRIDTEYDEMSVSEQNIKVNSVINPLCVLADRNARDEMKRKAKRWYVFSKMPNAEFDAKYPKADRVSFEMDQELESDLNDDDHTWVAEYWVKKPVTRHLCLLSNGKTIDKNAVDRDGKPLNAELPPDVTVVDERKARGHKICQYLISGNAVLEGPNEWAGQHFPFVPVYGEYMVVDGKIVWYGLPRFSKDAQRAHNWAMTSLYERIASSTNAQWMATAKQALGHTAQWAEAHKKNFPFMLYNTDPDAPGPPQRIGGADMPVAQVQAAQMSAAALNNTTGITLANEGRVSNETSGRAIRARQDEGMVATYNFGDNMAKAHKRIAEIVLDLIPKIYDTQRNLRILGKDGSEKYIRVNQPDATGKIMNDLSQGKCDIVVTTGPSFATQRQEAAEFYTTFSQANPVVAAVAADLIVKAQDYPMSDAIAERLRMGLPPAIQQAINQDKPLPPEAQAALQQAELAMQQVQEMGQQVQQASQEAQTEKAGADKAKADVQIAIANLRTEEAKLAKDVADFKTFVVEQELKLAQAGNTKDGEVEKATLSAQLDSALADITQQGAQLFQKYASELAQMHGQALSTAQPQVVVANQPMRKRVRAKKVAGEWLAEVEEVGAEPAAA
jgi:hypothetical protein